MEIFVYVIFLVIGLVLGRLVRWLYAKYKTTSPLEKNRFIK